MARNLAVAQFVYKYATESNISPIDYTPTQDICQYLKGAIVSIGVQAPQGTKMYINGTPAYVGPTGVFELDNVIEITSFYLEDQVYLRQVIIDVLYDKESE